MPVLSDRIEDRADGLRRISDGVPPPRKIEVTSRPGARAADVSISRAKACTKRASSIGACRTWLLKSQYGHFDRQNGQCT